MVQAFPFFRGVQAIVSQLIGICWLTAVKEHENQKVMNANI